MAIFQKCCRRWFSLSRERCSRCEGKLSDKREKIYAVDIYLQGRRQRVVVGSNKSDAKRIEQRERARVQNETLGLALPSRPFRHLAERYLARVRNTPGEKTAKTIFSRLVKEWGGLRTDRITPAMIEELRTAMLAEGKSKRWIDYHMALLRSAYNVAHLPNPVAKIRFFNPNTKVVRYLTTDERKALLSQLQRSPPHLQEIFLVSLDTGLRRGTVTRLRRDEVDFCKKIIAVRISARSRGDKPHVVPMTHLVMEVLKDIPENDTPWFWVNPKTGQPYKDLKKSWATLKKRAGITRTFRWHDLRHDFLSRVVTTTGSLRIAQELAGHSDPRMTDRYAHLIDVGLHEVVERISDHLVTRPDNHEKDSTK